MSNDRDLDPATSAALDAWARGATTEVLERATVTADSSAAAPLDGPTLVVTRSAGRLRARRLAVSVCVVATLAAAAVIVALVVAPKLSTVRLRPAGDLPAQSDKPGRGENVAAAYVEPAWWPSALHSPVEARGIGSRLEQQSWLIRHDGVVVAVASLVRSDGPTSGVPTSNVDLNPISGLPTDGVEESLQVDPHDQLVMSSSQLTGTQLDPLIQSYRPASRTFVAGPSTAAYSTTADPDGWIPTNVTGDIDFSTVVVKWSGDAEDDRQLAVGGRKVADADSLVAAIGQFNPTSTATTVGSSPAVLISSVDGHAHLYWAVSPTVLGTVDGLGMQKADLLHAARTTAVVPRSWWQQISHRKRIKRTVHGFRIADTDAYVAGGSLGTYRWLMTRGVDGLFLTYSDRAGHFLGGEGRFDSVAQLQDQPTGTLAIGGGGSTSDISLNLPHGSRYVHVTIDGAAVPSALFHLPGTSIDKVIAIGKVPGYNPNTTLGTVAPTAPNDHATVTATLPDGSPYNASV